MARPQKFWMVKGEGPANHIHSTREYAEAEAKRLAIKNPGKSFYVLEAVSVQFKRDVEWVDLNDPSQCAENIDDEIIPF